MATVSHIPVLYHEIIHALQPKSPGFYVDGTLGAGGHARGIMEACAPNGCLLGIEIDPQALALARETLAPYVGHVQLVQASYTSLSAILKERGWNSVQGILLDLGVSSMQLNTAARGFSFQYDGPLDMRFDPSNPLTADHLVNKSSEAELADILHLYGEEPSARRIAHAIIQARPVTGTKELAEIVIRAAGKQHGRINPATRTFQALRIKINDELNAIECVLPQVTAALAPGGRLAIISFHSLEDRIVKKFIRSESRDCLCPTRQPICTCGHKAVLKEITRKPIRSGNIETNANIRARSARLRVAERI
jgi:16S rRNA (cytosine1402-N4)-methyltransferase